MCFLNMKSAKLDKTIAVAMSQHKSLRDSAGQAGGLKKKLIAVAMSGGVDSSTTALLLKKQGFEPMGFFMRLIDRQTAGELAARKVCRKLNIKFYVIDLSKQFKKLVIDYFLTGYRTGLTPNPCIRCNQLIKFGELLKAVKSLGADYLATGHYVKIFPPKADQPLAEKIKNKYKLLRAKDKTKDQSYFLYTLTQKQLTSILFPLGNYTKKQVRQIAERADLPYLKQESQDICFLAGGDHNNFLRQNLKLTPGPIVLFPSLKKGRIAPLVKGGRGVIIGQHQGLPLYTIGQRRGVKIGGSGPYYVVKTDYKTNTLFVVKNYNDLRLFGKQLTATKVNWLSGKQPKFPLTCQAVIRYRHPAVKCKITPLVKGGKGIYAPLKKGGRGVNVLVRFSQPQRAITLGQSVVFYQGNQVLGGGVIK